MLGCSSFACTAQFLTDLEWLFNVLGCLFRDSQLDWALMLLAHRWIKLLLIVIVFVITCYLLVNRVLSHNVEAYTDFSDLLQDLSAETALLRNDNLVDSLFAPPLRTHGRHIVDNNGTRFKLVSVNWYGASDEFHIPGGLDVQHRDSIAKTIRLLGFNSVRLPYADQMVRDNREIADRLLLANPDLIGSRALAVYEAVVNSLTEAGLAVILNNHITQCRWCCDGNPCDLTWTNSFLGPMCSVRQTEEDWIANWQTIIRPHLHNPRVVGVDLRNEPRGLLGAWGWNAWAAAAERLGERMLAMNPDLLIIVEGTHSANYLARASSRPVRLSVRDRLVYSAHVYGWSGWGSLSGPYWGRDYSSFAKDMRKNWGFLLERDVAPVWIGEMGVPAKPKEGDMHYWKNLIRYLREMDADFGFWAINPRKPKNNVVETYSLVHDDWLTPRWDYRLYDMAQLKQSRLSEKG